MKHNINLPSVLVWIIYPVTFTIFIIFCFMTCDSKPLGSENTEPPVPKDTSSFVMTFVPDNFKQPVERTAYRSYKAMPDINCSSRVDHIPAERFRAANYFSPVQRLRRTVDPQCLISL